MYCIIFFHLYSASHSMTSSEALPLLLIAVIKVILGGS